LEHGETGDKLQGFGNRRGARAANVGGGENEYGRGRLGELLSLAAHRRDFYAKKFIYTYLVKVGGRNAYPLGRRDTADECPEC
jgi:hypothetical protein